jgi:hypothetical protein
MLLLNVYHKDQIPNTSIGTGYDIRVACKFSIGDTISIHDLKRQIYVGLELFSSHFNLTISVRNNTAQSGLSKVV